MLKLPLLGISEQKWLWQWIYESVFLNGKEDVGLFIGPLPSVLTLNEPCHWQISTLIQPGSYKWGWKIALEMVSEDGEVESNWKKVP